MKKIYTVILLLAATINMSFAMQLGEQFLEKTLRTLPQLLRANFSSYQKNNVFEKTAEQISEFNKMPKIQRSESLKKEIEERKKFNKANLYYDKNQIEYDNIYKNFYKLQNTSEFDNMPKIQRSESLKKEIEERKASKDSKSKGRRFIPELGGSNILFKNHLAILGRDALQRRVDLREKVDNPYMSPYNNTVHLDLDFRLSQNQKFIHSATGILISNKHVLTAAHNLLVHKPEKGFANMPDGILVTIGRDGAQYQYKFSTEAIEIHQKYKDNNGNPYAFDIGLITLNKDPSFCRHNVNSFDLDFQNSIQKVNLADLEPKDLLTKKIVIPGFPGNKAKMDKWFYMYNGLGMINNVEEEMIFYDADASGGNSGSGVFLEESFKNNISQLVGIHSGIELNDTGLDNIEDDIIKIVLDNTDEDIKNIISDHHRLEEISRIVGIDAHLVKDQLNKTVNILSVMQINNRGVRLTKDKIKSIRHWQSL